MQYSIELNSPNSELPHPPSSHLQIFFQILKVSQSKKQNSHINAMVMREVTKVVKRS